LLERFDDFGLAPDASLEHLPGLALRTLKSLRIRYALSQPQPETK
jgi:hypothetical protein